MNASDNDTKTNLTDELAKERTREAADRTLNAWIRTSISLIVFGFAIAKPYEYVETGYEQQTGRILDPSHAPVIFGAAFIILGLLGTLAAVIQYGRILDRHKKRPFYLHGTASVAADNGDYGADNRSVWIGGCRRRNFLSLMIQEKKA